MSDPATQNAEVQAKAAEREAMEVLQTAKAVIVTTPQQFQDAGVVFASIKAKLRDLETQRVAITKPMNDALRNVNDLFRRPKEALEAALAPIERAMASYKREEERKRREAEAEAEKERKRLQEEADKKAAEERTRLDEIRRKEEEARQAAANAPNPVAAFIQQRRADELAQEADQAAESTMDAIRESAMVQAPVTYIPKATAAGVATRKNWRFEIVDASLVPREFLIPDEKKIGEHVRTMQDKTSIPGVRVWDEIKIGGR